MKKGLVGGLVHRAENSQAFGKIREHQAAEQKRRSEVFRAFVVNKKVALRDAVAQSDDFGSQAVQPDAQIAILAEQEWPAVFKVESVFRLDALVGGVIEDAVVEDLAILIDFDKGRTFVAARPGKHLRQVIDI